MTVVPTTPLNVTGEPVSDKLIRVTGQSLYEAHCEMVWDDEPHLDLPGWAALSEWERNEWEQRALEDPHGPNHA